MSSERKGHEIKDSNLTTKHQNESGRSAADKSMEVRVSDVDLHDSRFKFNESTSEYIAIIKPSEFKGLLDDISSFLADSLLTSSNPFIFRIWSPPATFPPLTPTGQKKCSTCNGTGYVSTGYGTI